MKRVLAYLRVSTASQTDGDGFPRQEAECRKFAESKGWFVARALKEQQSGSDQLFDRPVMQELLALCDGYGQFDTIIVERVDRIARDVVVAELFFRECKKKGVSVYAADSGEELVNATGDPTRTLIRQILGALAEWDKAQICKKLQAGRRRKARETGKPCGGPLPYGNSEDGETNAQENWILDTIVQYVRAGRSLRWIARWFQLHHVPTPKKAERWSGGIVHNLYRKNAERIISPDNEIYHRSFIEKFEQAARRDRAPAPQRRESQADQSSHGSSGCPEAGS